MHLDRGAIKARPWTASWLVAAVLGLSPTTIVASAEGAGGGSFDPFAALRAGIEDLAQTYGNDYPESVRRLAELKALEHEAVSAGSSDARKAVSRRFDDLRREALLAHPLLRDGRVLLVKRMDRSSPAAAKLWSVEKVTKYGAGNGLNLGFPSNHECNSSLPREGYTNELAVLSLANTRAGLTPVFRPDDTGYVGEMDLHWDAERILFTKSDRESWKIWEIGLDGSGLRQVSRMPADVDCGDACYLPDGGIGFGSTASFQSVPCWHGQKWVSNLYRMDADGTGVRQLCFDQDHNLHPTVMDNGQVLYHRWDYTGINHIFMRQLMVMNPDGTGQRAVYGSNSWFPNSLYFPRALPGAPGRLVCILSGYHGVHKLGQLVVIDFKEGWQEGAGIVQRISGRGEPVKPMVKDNLVDADWPKFLHPWPVDDKRFLVACQPDARSDWGLYLADVFDNLVRLYEEPGHALLEPVLIRPRPVPPVLPDRVDPARQDAVVYLHDVHSGPGLAGVPRGTVKQLRLLAYHFGYRHLAGPDKVGRGGPWEVMRILGTVPVEADGSAFFRVPANTPLAVQPLDADGQAVQLMRSWFTAMPGENVSCVGCHEEPRDVAPPARALAARRSPSEIKPWFGPARGFDFAREVQPVLDERCVGCHDGRPASRLDLRAEAEIEGYQGLELSQLGRDRLHPDMAEATGGNLRYTPAYEALLPYVRRVGIEDDVSLLRPGEYCADTSELIQLLQQGHYGVELDHEDWDRLVTWIDLNAPCHGAWGDVFPIPEQSHERRMALRREFGGPIKDPEVIPELPVHARRAATVTDLPVVNRGGPAGEAIPAFATRDFTPGEEGVVDLGGGQTLRLVQIPAGEFTAGSTPEPLRVTRPFWLAACEISNAQFRRFDAGHDPRYYAKRHARSDDQGLPLNGPEQPAVRVSWDKAMAFCDWLSERSGLRFRLPGEVEWEWACRAGTSTPLSYGTPDDDFAPYANLGDASFRHGFNLGRTVTGGVDHLAMEGAALADHRFDDGAIVTAPVGARRPNAWGLHDMHGNAAEWTLSHPDGNEGLRVVRGGSFFDRPERARSDHRVAYPPWRRVFDVGFRVVAEAPDARLAIQ